MQRVLVAGASGYLGRYLVSSLKREGCWVRVLVRRLEQAEALREADDVVVGEVTDPATIAGVADGVDTVFSSVGITRQKDGVGYDEVDYAGNLALLRAAENAGVHRFAYVSVLHGQQLRHGVRLVAAKERFVDALTASPLESLVVRPTGYFSDMTAFSAMAGRGTAYLIGDGLYRMNPISGRDLAEACVQAAATDARELEVGGPDVLTHRQIALMAFAAAGNEPRLRRVPAGLVRAAVWLLCRLTPERVHGPVQFVAAVMTADMIAPARGNDHLRDHFEAEAQSCP